MKKGSPHAFCVFAQRVFINSLATDYGKWATDAGYRQERVRFAAESDKAIAQSHMAEATM